MELRTYVRLLLLLCLLGMATACARLSRQSTRAGYHASCGLTPVSGLTIAYRFAQQAVRDFAQQPGYPYSLLYLETHAGSSPSSTICVRLVQHAESQFTFYRYRNQQVQAVAVTDASWGQLLAQVRPGHFVGTCDNYATEPAEGIVLVKRGSTVISSLDISLHERGGFTGVDKERVEAALKLVRSVVAKENSFLGVKLPSTPASRPQTTAQPTATNSASYAPSPAIGLRIYWEYCDQESGGRLDS